MGKSNIIDYEPTILLNKFKKELAKLWKKRKVLLQDYYKVYPSDAIPPRLHSVRKGHKPEKNN